MKLFNNIESLAGIVNAPYEAIRKSLYTELCRATAAEKRGRHDRVFVNNLLGHLEYSSEENLLYFESDDGFKAGITERNLVPYVEKQGREIKIRTLVWEL